MEKLDQAKQRDKKIYINDIAISKIPLIRYKGFDDDKNTLMKELAQSLLQVAKDENDSNEVAFTCDIGADEPLEEVGVSFGTEHEVDIMADTLSNHLIVSKKSVAVVLLHNHPSTQTFSLEDIQFFLQYEHIEVIVVVSNQGTIHYLMRDNDYDVTKAFELIRNCIEGLAPKSSFQEFYFASLSFLAKCSEVGLYYR